jgi:D-tyrosyl-tRNA(Tyr) deacylase
MKIVFQRVLSANVKVSGSVVGSISKGILAYVGLTHTDTPEIAKKLAEKLLKFRIFDSERKGFDHSVLDIKGEVLVISQFTVYGNCNEGLKPNFSPAMEYSKAEELYKYFISELRKSEIKIDTGIFGAMMEIESINDGPVTLILEKN